MPQSDAWSVDMHVICYEHDVRAFFGDPSLELFLAKVRAHTQQACTMRGTGCGLGRCRRLRIVVVVRPTKPEHEMDRGIGVLRDLRGTV